MHWCYLSASAVGLSHLRAGTRLQDANQSFVCDSNKGRRFFAIVADGAGSAEFGGQGASIVCRTLTTLARDALRGEGDLPDDEEIWVWIDLARYRIQLAAGSRGKTPRDFAATLVLLMASSDEVVTAHIGDGAVVARDYESGGWTILSKPHHGDYASTTYFVTDDPEPALRIGRFSNHFDALALFSDGIENLVLDSMTGEPSPSFFNPMVKPLSASVAIGKDLSLSKNLAAFLASERINERTDDDKTLIVAIAK